MSQITESEFNDLADQVYEAIRTSVEALANEHDLDLEVAQQGNVLEVMFPAGQKIVINTQRPWRQIWVASPLGAAHFSQQGETWFSERDDLDLGTLLSRWVSQFLQRDCLIRVANLR